MRYRAVYRTDPPGAFYEFSAASDADAIERATHSHVGEGLLLLDEVTGWGSLLPVTLPPTEGDPA